MEPFSIWGTSQHCGRPGDRLPLYERAHGEAEPVGLILPLLLESVES